MTPSPLVQVQFSSDLGTWHSTSGGVDIVSGDIVSIRLADTSEVGSWYLTVIGYDEVTATPPVLVNVSTSPDSIGKVVSPVSIVSFTAPSGYGRALILRSSVNGQSSYSTFEIFIRTADGFRVGALGEQLEGNSTFGWTGTLNQNIRNTRASSYLKTSSLPVDVGSSNPPSIGDVLTATSSTSAVWKSLGNLITNLPLEGGGDLFSNVTLSLSLGAANSVLYSNGLSDTWSIDPIVNSIRGLSHLYVGTIGSDSDFTPNTWTFAPGNSDITCDSVIRVNCGGSNLLQLDTSGTIGNLQFSSLSTEIDVGISSTALSTTAATLTVFGQSSSAASSVGGDLILKSGVGTSSNGSVKSYSGTSLVTVVSSTGLSLNSHPITSVTDPTNPQDVATKHYVDSVAVGLQIKDSVEAIATSDITSLSGLSQVVDAVALDTDGYRVLLTAEGTSSLNGIWVVHTGSWTRATDMATGSHAAGSFTFVTGGSIYGDSGWVCSNAAGSDVVDTDSLAFTQFSATGQVTAGAGLVKTGTILDIVSADASLVINSDSIQVGVITNLNVAAGASIGVTKLALGGTSQFITSNGHINSWASMSDLLHGDLGGGSLHAVVSSTANGFAPGLGSANSVLLTIDGTTPSWSQVTNAMLAGSIAWSKLTGYPTITATSPLTISGGTSADLSTDRTIAVNSVSGSSSGVVPAIGSGTYSTLVSTSGYAATWIQGLTNSYISSSAAIAVTKLALGGSNQVLSSNGTTNSWGSVTSDMITSLAWTKITSTPTTISGYGITNAVSTSRTISTTAPLTGGGALSSDLTLAVSSVSSSSSGVVPSFPTGYPLVLRSNGSSAGWALVSDAYISDLTFAKITSLPTITTTAPLTGGGTLGALTLGISAASASAAGSMSAAHYTRLASIPDAIGSGYLLYDSGAGAYALVAPSTLSLIQGSGTANYLPKFGSAKVISNSSITDDGSTVTINSERFVVSGSTGNTYARLKDTGSSLSDFILVTSYSSTIGNFYLQNVSSSVVSWLTTSTGNTGFGGILSPSANVDTTTLRIRGGTPGTGKLLQSDSVGTATWSNSLTELTSVLLSSSATSYQISQANLTSGNGNTLGIMAQSATGSGALGGTLQLRAGVGSGTNSGKVSYGGYVEFWAGVDVICRMGIDEVQVRTPISFYEGLSSCVINQEPSSAASASGKPLNIIAQTCTGTSSTGGNLVLGSGTGTSSPGYVSLELGGYQMLAMIYNKGLRLSAYSAGELSIHMQNSSSTSPTLLDQGALFVWSGALYYKGSSGTVTKIANA